MQELTSAGYKGEEYDGLYNQMVFIYNKTLGEKVSILTFMLDENNTIRHSNTYNEQMLSPLLKNKDNMNMIYKETESNEFGEVTLNNENEQEIMYFHKIIISNGKQFFLFMGVDRERIISNLNANEIIIPICIVCMLLLGLAEYAVWMNIIYKPVHFQRNKS